MTVWQLLGGYLILSGIVTVIYAIVFARRGIKRRPLTSTLERRP